MSSVQYDPFTLQFEKLTASFWSFLHNGLGTLLSSRPLSPFPYYDGAAVGSCSWSCGCGDLIHVLEMAVSSEIPKHISSDSLSVLTRSIQGNDHDHHNKGEGMLLSNTILKSWQKRAEQLMLCIAPLHFSISYNLRSEIVHILQKNLVLTEEKTNVQYLERQFLNTDHHHQYDDDDNGESNSGSFLLFNCCGEFLYSAVIHLQASLRTFAVSALTKQQTMDAKRALVNIAVGTGEERFVNEELNSLMKFLMEEVCDNERVSDSINYCTCRGGCDGGDLQKETARKRERLVHMQRYLVAPSSKPNIVNNSTFLQQLVRKEEIKNATNCIHCETGDVLRDFILRHNGSRYYADGSFTRRALKALSKCFLKRKKDDERNRNTYGNKVI